MSIKIVVARYNEDIEWTKQFENVIIYNKGEKLSDDFNQVILNNVGREGHTYYKYIYDNYDNLDDYTIFLQANPFDHSPDIINTLNRILNNGIDKEFDFLSQLILNCNLSGCIYHPDLPLIETYEKIFNEKKENMEFPFGAGAQFIVSKKNILKHPKVFYNNIIELLNYDINPIEGYVIERFHKLILDNYSE